MSIRRRGRALGMCLATGTLALAAGLPTLARACGGTFCDGGGPPMPVEQTGEEVLFVQEGDSLETHVRIRYDGQAENFAWIVPVMGEPEIGVGSDPLFTRLMFATSPRTTVEDDCETNDWGCGFANCTDNPPANDLPDVVDEFMVGTFEGAVLDGGTVDGVMEWLGQNGYDTDPAAEPILAEYLEEGFSFVAFKLRGGADVDEIHPIIIRQQTQEPCVPIRLTRVAAEDDMSVRVYFLDDARWVPTNYRHVELNKLHIPWPEWRAGLGDGYEDLLTLAVDEAGGRAFATDFAGPTEIPTQLIANPNWDSSAFEGTSPQEAMALMVEQGLFVCDEFFGCVGSHPLVAPATRDFLPAPDGMAEPLYWYQQLAGAEQSDPDAWAPAQLGQRLEERVFAPGRHAAELVESYPYLTAMRTTISPHEMTRDPVFSRNYEAGDVGREVSGRVWPLYNDLACERFSVYDVDGTKFCTGREWPQLGPYASRIEQYLPDGGPPLVSYDGRADVERAVAEHNETACLTVELPEPPELGEGDESAGGEESGGTGADGSRQSCACDARGSGNGAGWGLLALIGIATARRKNR